MPDWSNAQARMVKLAMGVTTEGDGGTGFLLHRTAKNLVIGSAWHVIEHLLHVDDKYCRRFSMVAADGSYSAVANVVGVVRLGDERSDVGLVWVGPPFGQKGINDTLHALAQSGIRDGRADFSGGGGVVKIEGNPANLLQTPLPDIIALDQLKRGMNVGLMGYPTKPPPNTPTGSIAFFESSITGFSEPHFYFVDWCGRDGMAQKGISGGPVFDEAGQLAGLISSFEPNYEAMQVVPVPKLPWID